jgi:Zn-dependent peptidase ImmA (M78 family)
MHSVPPESEKRAWQRQEVFEGLVVARRLREELGLSDDQPVACVVELAEQRLGMDVVLSPLPDDVSGFYLPVPPRPLVVVSATHPVGRQRFTLAHEVGHHALGHGAAPRIQEITAAELVSPDTEPALAAPPSTELVAEPADHYRVRPSSDPDERAANAFAGELLCPEAGARELTEPWSGEPPLDQVVRLSSHYGISAFSALVRLQMLGAFKKPVVELTRAELIAGRHVVRYRELELPELDDQLQRHAAAGGGARCSSGARAVLARLRAEVDAA